MSNGTSESVVMPNVCRLCLDSKQLMRSHILPEFFWKEVYEIHQNGSRRVPMTACERGAIPGLTHHQKALREQLLCSDCEQKLGKWESYVKRMFLDLLPSNPRNSFSLQLDLRVLLLFQLSMLWRSGITTHDGLALYVPQELIEVLRQCLVNDDPNNCPIEYSMVPVYVEGKDIPIHFSTNGIMLDLEEGNGSVIYRILAGGVVWSYRICNKPPQYPRGRVEIGFHPCNVFDFDFLYRIADTWFGTADQ